MPQNSPFTAIVHKLLMIMQQRRLTSPLLFVVFIQFFLSQIIRWHRNQPSTKFPGIVICFAWLLYSRLRTPIVVIFLLAHFYQRKKLNWKQKSLSETEDYIFTVLEEKKIQTFLNKYLVLNSDMALDGTYQLFIYQ